jgi:hypothetical protein
VRLITSMEVIDWPPRKLAFGDDSLADLAQSINGQRRRSSKAAIWRRIMSSMQRVQQVLAGGLHAGIQSLGNPQHAGQQQNHRQAKAK